MKDLLEKSWSAIAPEVAKIYLDGYGHPSTRSKELLVDFLLEQALDARPLRILDLGCGNGQLLRYFRLRGLSCSYVGVDFSLSLLASAEAEFQQDPDVHFINDDVQTLSLIDATFDFAVFSHVIEILPCPEQAIKRAATLARKTLIRFFEPPEFDMDSVELRDLDLGNGTTAPYLRRKMSRDYYRLLLANCDVKQVQIYQAEGDKDQLHVLSFNGR